MIKKILDKQSKAESHMLDEATAVNEVKLLLNSDAIEDLHLLQSAFPSSSNSKVLSENADKEHTKKLKEIHNGDVYTLQEIKMLCMKYRLRFLPSTYYKGNIPLELLRELKTKFSEQNKLAHMANGTNTLYERNLFMVAPASMFNVKSYSQTKREELQEIKRLKKLDPACFAKIDDNKYLFLKEWGNSFSVFRRIIGVLTAKHKTINWLFFSAWLCFVAIVVCLTIKVGALAFVPISKDSYNPTLWFFPFLVSLVGGGLLVGSWVCSANFGFFMAHFKDQNIPFFKTDKRLATENNWRNNN